MREIKFRAWISKAKLMLRVTDIDFEDKSIGCQDNSSQWSDHECLIMQYTGLKDKNGVEIYEGDITNEGAVRWYDNLTFDGDGSSHAGFYFDCGWDDYSELNYHLGFAKHDNIEVIGNIHENPELMKGVNDEP